MNFIDIIILILLILGGLNGLRQGLIKALANLIGWVVALIFAAKYTNTLAPLMSAISVDPVVQKIAAFAFIVLFIVVLTWIVGAVLNKLLKTLKLGPLNRLAGGVFGASKSLLIVLITMQGLGPWVESSPYWKQSKLVNHLAPYAPAATEFSKDVASEAMNQMKSEVNPRFQPNQMIAHEQRPHVAAHVNGSTTNPFN